MVFDRFFDKLLKLNLVLDRCKFLSSIKKAFSTLIPIFLLGSICLILLNFPIPTVQNFLKTTLQGSINEILFLIYNATFGLISLYVIIALTYYYAKSLIKGNNILLILACINSLGAYIISLGLNQIFLNAANADVVLFSDLGFTNIFSALIISFVSTRIFVLVSTFFLNRKKISASSSLDYKYSMVSLVAIMVNFTMAGLFNLLLVRGFHVGNLNELIILILSKPFDYLGNNFFSALLIILFQTFLWFFGIHGSNALETVQSRVFSDSGLILSKNSFDTMVLMGGCGAVIGLVIAILIFYKYKAKRKLMKGASVFMIFNVNESVVFGLPIVSNPVYFIPFLLAPVVTLSTTYLSMKFGWVPIADNVVQWTTPILFNGYQATGSIAGVFLQIVNVILATAIYTPFVLLDNKLFKHQFKEINNKMLNIVVDAEKKGDPVSFYSQPNYISSFAKEMAMELRQSMENRTVKLFYQPQSDKEGAVVGCEALLRWNYQQTEHIYPPVVIALAKEEGIFEELTEYIIDEAIIMAKSLNTLYGDKVPLSINLQVHQFCDFAFMKRLVDKLKDNEILPFSFGVEITEEEKLLEYTDIENIFKFLEDNKVFVSLDDFSMGQTSIAYLQHMRFKFVKIDGNLIREVVDNGRSRDIIKNVAQLGSKLNYHILAEFVETNEQKHILDNLGCSIFQGYLFSKAIPEDEFIEYVNINNPE